MGVIVHACANRVQRALRSGARKTVMMHCSN